MVIHGLIECPIEQQMFEIEIFCKIMDVFTVRFDQFSSLLYKIIYNFLKKVYELPYNTILV